jgi:hypothetical protein
MTTTGRFGGLALAVDVATRLPILHPITRQPLRDKDGNECWIDLIAAESSVGRAHDRLTIDNQIRAGTKRLTSEQIDATLNEKLAKLTKGWKLATLEGEPLDVECTQSTARELYSLTELTWLRAAVLEFVADLGNFRPAVSKS